MKKTRLEDIIYKDKNLIEITRVSPFSSRGNTNLYAEYCIGDSEKYGINLEYTKKNGYEYIGGLKGTEDLEFAKAFLEKLFTSKFRIKAISGGLPYDLRVWSSHLKMFGGSAKWKL